MSLTSHIEKRTKIGEFLLNQVVIPELPDFIYDEPIVKHTFDRYSLLGTAFDYLVRMSIATQKDLDFYPKIAGMAVAKYRRKTNDGKKRALISRQFFNCNKATKKAILENDIELMAQNSLSFARLDPFFRSSRWDEDWIQKSTDSEDIQELLALHALWIESFSIPDDDILLNPSFESSRLLGGADADIMVGEAIVDWKVVNNPKREIKKSLAQLIGYSILASLDGKSVSNCIIYFARHGKQLSIPFDEIMRNTSEEVIESFKKLTSKKPRHMLRKKSPVKLNESLITTGVTEIIEQKKMILRTKFSIFKGVGFKKEQIIYSHGIKNWDDYVKANEIKGVSAKLHVSICEQIEKWDAALHGFDSKFFFQNLKTRNHWMLFSLFSDNVCYLDIETTGLSPDHHNITLVGLYNGSNYVDLVRGHNLSKQQIQAILKDCKLLVTFYGLCFDIPFLVKKFVGINLDIPHFDLCFGGRKIGLTGGLKLIEQELGISRDQKISNVNGFEAVKLWHSYNGGNKRALKKLRDYCKEDTVNLSKLAPIIFANLSSKESSQD